MHLGECFEMLERLGGGGGGGADSKLLCVCLANIIHAGLAK